MTDLKTKNIKYEDYLNMRNFLNNEYKTLSIPSRIEPIAPIIERTTQEELNDMELQRKKAFDILTKELSINPLDAGNIVNNMLITNDPEELINFNSYYRGFKEEIRGQSNLTPDVFNVLWNRYKEKIKELILTIPSRLYGKTPEANTEEMIKEFMDIDYEADLTAEENRKKREAEYNRQLSKTIDLKAEYYKAVKKSLEYKSDENEQRENFYKNELIKAFNKLNRKDRFLYGLKSDILEFFENSFINLTEGMKMEDVIKDVNNIKDEQDKTDFLNKYRNELIDINSVNDLKYNLDFEINTIKNFTDILEKEKTEELSEPVKYMVEQIEINTNELNDLKDKRANRLYVLKQDLKTIKENLRNAQSRNDQEQINNFTIQYAAEKERIDNFDNLEAIKEIDKRIKTIENRLNLFKNELSGQEKEDNDTIEKAIKKLYEKRQEIKQLKIDLLKLNKINFEKKITDMTIQDIKNVVYSFQNDIDINIQAKEDEDRIKEEIKKKVEEYNELSKKLVAAESDRFIKENEFKKLRILRKAKKIKTIEELKEEREEKEEEGEEVEEVEEVEEEGEEVEEAKKEIIERIRTEQIPLKFIETKERRRIEELERLSREDKRTYLKNLKEDVPEQYLFYLINLYDDNSGTRSLYLKTDTYKGKKNLSITNKLIKNYDTTEDKIKFMENAFFSKKRREVDIKEIKDFIKREGLPIKEFKGGKIKSKKNKTKKNKTKKINDKYINL